MPIQESALRGAVRLLLLLLASVALLVLTSIPIALASLGGRRARFKVVLALTPLFGHVMAFCCGLHVRVVGKRQRDALVFVGNHVGYLDILVATIGVGGVFVSRHDVKDWPVIGLFARLAGTVFIDRSSIRSAVESSAGLAERAREGVRIALFPEGGTSSGDTVRDFKPFLFGAVSAAGFIVQPYVIHYTHIGNVPLTPENRNLVYWYDPAPPFHTHGWRMLKLPSVHATITFLEPVAPPRLESPRESARALAELLHQRVGSAFARRAS
ncbi:MAG TPA: lysophospholipid acyltransferase family protein [Candidatus Kapabacteria bacterium]|nr:lysophospholipid acyltransferase family protein [Candidatus Kapabacteria bacterium]